MLGDLSEVRRALDHFYPARSAAYAAWDDGRLKTTPLRETLNRQTGMYRVAANIPDEQANVLVASFCRSDGGCLRTILWRRDAPGAPASTLLPAEKFDPAFDRGGESALPLLCQEGCNLLVAEARRKMVKASEADGFDTAMIIRGALGGDDGRHPDRERRGFGRGQQDQ